MMTDAAREFWWQTFGLLALESALVIGVATMGRSLVQSVLWRRTIWQGCVVALLALVTIEFYGGSRRWLSRPSTPAATLTHARPRALPVSLPLPRKPSAAEAQGHASPSPGKFAGTAAFGNQAAPSRTRQDQANLPASTESSPAANLGVPTAGSEIVGSRMLFVWAILFWGMGTLVLLAKSFFSRAMLALLRQRSTPVKDGPGLERLEVLCADLKLRRRVRLFESERLSSPVACGLFFPAIGLPPGFGRIQETARQEVMLVHELAHLQAGDPLWYWMGDIVVALWWWQPMVWWMRRQLHAASECAADEASLLVADGPGVLAECLVELGQRLTGSRPTGWLGVEGGDFRSGLGRRVERLLGLGARSWQPPKFLGSVLARTLAPAGLIAVVGLATAWTIPVTSTEGDSMKKPLWNKPATALALAWAFGTQAISGIAADTNALARPAAAGQEILAGGGGGGGGGGRRSQQTRPLEPGEPAISAGTNAKIPSKLKAKLDSIVLDEVTYDCLPLSQVIESLIKESAKRDPEKTGINFLMGKATEVPASSIDPATGLPMKGQEPLDLASVTVRIQPPLRKVRLVDVLDAITRVADRPVRYSIEDYAVVWTPVNERPGASLTPVVPAPPQVRAFKFETNVFIKSLEKAFNVHAEGNSAEIREILWRHVFPSIGLNLDSETSALFYNDVTGVLLVRATPQDLAIIQATVETLGGKPSASETASTSVKR